MEKVGVRVLRMRLFWIFALLVVNRAQSWTFEDVFLELINDGTNVLFPPSRLTIHVCVDPDDAIRLSRQLSANLLNHKIRNTSEGFDERLYDTYDHQNLYIFDLGCANVFQILQMANLSRMFVAPTRWLLLRDQRIADTGNRTDSCVHQDIIECFEDLSVYPDSDVVLATRFEQDYVELISIYRPSPYRNVILEDRGTWTRKDGLRLKTYDVASRRRRNLHLSPIKSCLVMTDPDTINHLTDYHNKHIDPVTKTSYPWLLYLIHRMNATLSFVVTNSWGYRSENGSWSGMTGMLQRREIDIGGTACFLVSQRLGVVQYIQLFARTGSRFIFQKPLLSTVSNIFSLPFQRAVWIAIGTVLLLMFILLYVSTKWEFRRRSSTDISNYWNQLNPAEQTLSDNLLVILGAVTQQGYSYEPYRVPSRIVTLMLLIATLSLYASYTANIVALLQSTTDSIKTPADLLNSPLKLGVQDVVYNRHYFKTFQDPVRKAIASKLDAKGGVGWMSIHEGTRRIKDELFAFHGEVGIVYKIMQETYQEEEKCGISEIDVLNVLYPLWVIQIQSPYLEIIKNSALLLRESGLKFREENRLYTNKPECHGQTNFITIGLTECYFALVTMGYGILCTVIVFTLEVLWYKRQERKGSDVQKMNFY